MGADGGSIPKRCELVRQKKKVEKLDKKVKDAHKWRNCQMTNEPLKKPIVACKLGRFVFHSYLYQFIVTHVSGYTTKKPSLKVDYIKP